LLSFYRLVNLLKIFLRHHPSGSLDLIKDLLVNLILHLLDQLRLNVYLLKLLPPLESHEILLPHVEHGLEAVDRLVLQLLLDHLGDCAHPVVFRAQGNVVVLITLESVVEGVEYVLLDDLGRNRDGSQFVSPPSHHVLLTSQELIQFEGVFRHSLRELRVRIHLVLRRDRGP
jgi:hypothetical protein